jgi:hypothetical protein
LFAAFVAYSAITFALVAVLAVFITLPIVNNYVNSVHTRVQQEMDFCKVLINLINSITAIHQMSARDIMIEVHEYRAPSSMPSQPLFSNVTREKRQSGCDGLLYL